MHTTLILHPYIVYTTLIIPPCYRLHYSDTTPILLSTVPTITPIYYRPHHPNTTLIHHLHYPHNTAMLPSTLPSYYFHTTVHTTLMLHPYYVHTKLILPPHYHLYFREHDPNRPLGWGVGEVFHTVRPEVLYLVLVRVPDTRLTKKMF